MAVEPTKLREEIFLCQHGEKFLTVEGAELRLTSKAKISR